MKRLLAIVFFWLSSIAFGATLVPVQLLNPTGSTAGQAIVSTGATTPPTWGSTSIPVSSITGLGTGVSAALGTAVTGTGGIVLGTAPTITTPNIVGVTTGANANAGSVGEYVTATGTSVAVSNNTSFNCASISLTAGDWDVWGNIVYQAAASTVIQAIVAGISTTSATLPATQFRGNQTGLTYAAGATPSMQAPIQVVSTASSVTAFLVGFSSFSTSTETATCYIAARRRH